MTALAQDFAKAFEAFSLTPHGRSIYAYAPVFRVYFGGQEAVLKRTQGAAHAPRLAAWTQFLREQGIPIVAPITAARQVGDRMWVLYPFVEGREYDGSLTDIEAAGRLLGQMHAQSSDILTPFAWPDNTPKSIQEDVENISTLAEFLPADVIERLTAWEHAFNRDVYAPLRDAQLPRVDASLDFKANNLIFSEADIPTLVDPDNGEHVPRIFDLALAALTFHLDLPGLGRVFTPVEWQTFYAAYTEATTLGRSEQDLWPLALRYMFQEWGVWHLTSAPQEWRSPASQSFLTSLATADLTQFKL